MPDTHAQNHAPGCSCCTGSSAADQPQAAASAPPTTSYPSGLHRVGDLDLRALLFYRNEKTPEGIYVNGLARWNIDLAAGKGLAFDQARNSDIGVGTPVSLSYHFMTALPSDHLEASILGPAATFRPLSVEERKIVVEELTKISNVTGITFTESASPDGKTLSFAVTSFLDAPATAGRAYFPYGLWLTNGFTFADGAGDVYLDRSYTEGMAKDGYTVLERARLAATIRHEISHALGLTHPFQGPTVLPDSAQGDFYTAMGYIDANDVIYGIAAGGVYLKADMNSVGVLDILALQEMYGKNTSFRSGNDIYTWDQKIGFREVIYDAGGTDTIDLSASTMRSKLDLSAVEVSSVNIRDTEADRLISTPAGYVNTAVNYRGNGNLAILGTIENVKGGSGDDRVNGNSANNEISGGGGNDSIWGGAGDDRIQLGAGNDRVVAGPGNNTVDAGSGIDVAGVAGSATQFSIVRALDGTVTVTRAGEVDTYTGTEFILFQDGNKLFWNTGVKVAGGFDESFYLLRNPDVAAAVANKALSSGFDHFIRFGQAEGRIAIDARSDIYFDESFYMSANPDVASAVAAGSYGTGWAHYQAYGRAEGRTATPLFDRVYYLDHNPDIKTAGIDPWQHFMTFGWQEGRDPSAFMDVSAYLDANPDLKAAKVNPVTHFLQFGHTEGRLLIATSDVGIDWTYYG